MSQLMLLIMSFANGVAFAKVKHPMNMGIFLLLQTVLVCLITCMMGQSSWFSYILFLVFLGGMLVLFIYMTSVASNEMFQKVNYVMMLFIIPIMIVSMLLIVLFIDPQMMPNNTIESIMNETWKSEKSSLMVMVFNMPNSIMTIFMVLYLFLTLIVVVSITHTHYGPLRSKN